MPRRFDRGPGRACYELSEGGIVCASLSGVVAPTNSGALSQELLKVTAEHAAMGVLCTVQTALVALPAIEAGHFGYLPPELRGVPVAVLITPEQMGVYQGIAVAAAESGAIRRAFLSREEAQRWLQEQARALAANRAWWSARRSLR